MILSQLYKYNWSMFFKKHAFEIVTCIAAPAASCHKMMKMMLLVLLPEQPERFHNLDGSWHCVVKFPALCICVRYTYNFIFIIFKLYNWPFVVCLQEAFWFKKYFLLNLMCETIPFLSFQSLPLSTGMSMVFWPILMFPAPADSVLFLWQPPILLSLHPC